MRPALRNRLKLRQVEIVLAVAEQGSFLAASYKLGVTQPAVSKAIGEIEDVLGHPVFDRVPRGVMPTAFGLAVIERGRAMLALVDRLADDLGSIEDGGGGTLAIGALPTAAASILPATLGRLRAGRPGLTVRIVQGRTAELMPQLESGKLDLVVGRLYELDTVHDVQRETIYHEPISVLARAGHPVLRRSLIDADALAEFGFVLPSLEQRLGQEVDGIMAYSGLASPTALPTALLRATSTSFIREMILSSDCLTILPRLMLAGDVGRGTVAVVPFPMAGGSRPAGIITLRHRRRPPSVTALIAALREHVRGLRRTGLLDPEGGAVQVPPPL